MRGQRRLISPTARSSERSTRPGASGERECRPRCCGMSCARQPLAPASTSWHRTIFGAPVPVCATWLTAGGSHVEPSSYRHSIRRAVCSCSYRMSIGRSRGVGSTQRDRRVEQRGPASCRLGPRLDACRPSILRPLPIRAHCVVPIGLMMRSTATEHPPPIASCASWKGDLDTPTVQAERSQALAG
jgi:hypothetical protein